MTEEVLLFEVAGAVARLTLNRPKAMNAMNMALVAELDRRLAQIAVDDAIRVLVVAGTGPAFCAGAPSSSPARANAHSAPART